MKGERPQRLGEAMRAELAELIARDVKDPRVRDAGLVTVTEVRPSPDLSFARVWVSIVGADQAKARAALAALAKASGWLRGEVGRRLGLRRAPELRWELDTSGEQAARIDELLREDHD